MGGEDQDEEPVEGCMGCIIVGCIGVKEGIPFVMELIVGFGIVDEDGCRGVKELRLWSGVIVRDWGFMIPDIDVVLCVVGAVDCHEKVGSSDCPVGSALGCNGPPSMSPLVPFIEPLPSTRRSKSF